MKQPVMTMTEAMLLADTSRGMGLSVGVCDYCHVVRPSAEMIFHEDRHEVCVLVTCRDCESDNVLSRVTHGEMDIDEDDIPENLR